MGFFGWIIVFLSFMSRCGYYEIIVVANYQRSNEYTSVLRRGEPARWLRALFGRVAGAEWVKPGNM
jgi:hypothetical protein